jgi:hypothetical protein
MSLDTLANIKSRLGITSSSDDTLLGLLQGSADQLINNYCNRNFEGGTFTEYHPGGSEFLLVRNYPLTSITSIKVDSTHQFGSETLISPSSYVVHEDRGVIQSLIGPLLPGNHSGLVNSNLRIWTKGPRMVQVIYTTNTNSVPTDVKEAYSRLVGHWYRRVKTESASNFQDVRQHKFGDTFVIYGSGNPSGLPQEAIDLLAPYRVPNL